MSSRMPMLCKEVHENSCSFIIKMHRVVFETRQNMRKKPISLTSPTKEPIPKYLTKHGLLLNY